MNSSWQSEFLQPHIWLHLPTCVKYLKGSFSGWHYKVWLLGSENLWCIFTLQGRAFIVTCMWHVSRPVHRMLGTERHHDVPNCVILYKCLHLSRQNSLINFKIEK
jgi:hypothetical protein